MSNQKYPQRQLGRGGPWVSAQGFGAMGIGTEVYGPPNKAASLETLTAAADAGVTFWDTADVYGDSELIIGEWFKKTGRRSEIFLCTKFGGRDMTTPNPMASGPRSDPPYIRSAVKRSLSRLGVDHIDLYYQHRVDAKVPIEAVIRTLGEFIDAGQIHWIGLSEASEETLRRAKSVPKYGPKVVAVQSEYSPFSLDLEDEPGYWKALEELGLGLVAYSPLGRGMLTGRFKSRADLEPGDWRLSVARFSEENFSKNLQMVDDINAVAKKYNATPAQVVLAWVVAQGEHIVSIPGSKTVERIRENAGAAKLSLTDRDIRAIREAADRADIKGDRYPSAMMPALWGDSLPLDQWKGEN